MSAEADSRENGASTAAAAAAATGSAQPTTSDAKDVASSEAKPQGASAADGTSSAESVAVADGKQDQAANADSQAASKDSAPITSTDSAAATAKANGKRRTSAGVPEHKNKKAGGKKGKAPPTLQLNVKPGEFYWARLKGHPPWPAVICDEEMLPEKIIENRPVTAQRPDGSYREDYQEGGKNVKDRTYAIMYLATYEFSWIPNIDLSPIDIDEVQKATQTKKTKALWAAYEQLKEQPDLTYFKNVLSEHERAIAEAEAEYEAAQKKGEEKLANKNKRKSKGAATDDEDVGDAVEDSAKPSKKRKKNADSEGEPDKASKTPKTKLKVSLKAPNGDSASKTKQKAKAPAGKPAKKAAEPELTAEEIFEIRKKQILYIRHKLQKGFLSRDTPPKEEEMEAMANHLADLEKETELEAPVIRATRINKVLKGILKLASIPRDSEFNFKSRSTKLLEIWNKTLAEDKTGEEETEKKENGKSASADAEPKPVTASKEEAKSETASAKETKEGKQENGDKASGPAVKHDEDTPMSDAPAAQADGPEATKDEKHEGADVKSGTASGADEATKGGSADSTATGVQPAEVTA